MFKNPIKHIPSGLKEEERLEKIHTVVFQKALDASISVANEIAELITQKASLYILLMFEQKNSLAKYKLARMGSKEILWGEKYIIGSSNFLDFILMGRKRAKQAD